ncbi:3TM-type holin [Microbulbifer sp. CnH-101-E]|uniref:3TM-type holin n=1 Tax=unclassified Microbulbifer TaxID=2619833 RepID=UPI00403931C6
MISAISDLFGKVIDKAFPDKTEANRLKAQVDSKLISMDLEELRAATQVITTEAGGESWLQRNWRPVTMLTFVGLIVFHWLGWTAPNLKAGYMTAIGAGTFAGWLANNWLGLAGVLIAAAGLMVNWYYNHKRLKLQEQQGGDDGR